MSLWHKLGTLITGAVLVLNAAPFALTGAPAPATAAATGRVPILLELFTSEGCSSCPPADQLLQVLDSSQPVGGADLIVLSEHVDYWNHDGWTDPYSSASFTDRQNNYAQAFHVEIFTPQLVIDGAAQTVGSRGPTIQADIETAEKSKKIPVSLTNAAQDGKHVSVHVQIGAPASDTGHAAVFLAIADNQDRSSVARGENAGQTLTHVAVVRSLSKVGSLDRSGFEKDVRVSLPKANASGLRIVVFLQDQSTHRVLGAAQQKL